MVDLEHLAPADDALLESSGDYCNYYNIGERLDGPLVANESPDTGLQMPTPYYEYQEGNGYHDTCQADGSEWGMDFGKESPKNPCGGPCAVQHFVSFHGQGTNDTPWSAALGEPSLVISVNALWQTFSHTATEDLGAWGYVCPLLEDRKSGNVIEYCLQPWRSIYNGSEEKEERVGQCLGYVEGHVFDQVRTFFSPITQWATEYAGSENTFEGSPPFGWRHFEAAITRANLEGAVAATNSTCGSGSSTSPREWALIGVENGIEGWDLFKEVGGAYKDLELRTGYTPLAPTVSTEAATEIHQTTATLNGLVTPNASATEYHFEYGLSSAYGTQTPERSAGSGASPLQVNAAASGLMPGMIYHYRIVAHNNAGTSVGPDRTFTVPGAMVAFQANTGELFTYSSTAWVTDTTEGMWPGTNPDIVGLTGPGGYVTAFTANAGELFIDSTVSGVVNTTEGMATATNASIAALSGGSYVVAFQANTGELFTYSPTNGVVDTHEGMMHGTSPSVAALSNGGYIVAFQANTGELFTYSPSAGVVDTTEGMWPGTAPSVTGLGNAGYAIAFTANSGELFIDSTAAGVLNTTEGMKTGTSPSIATLPNGTYVTAFQANTGELFVYSATTGVSNTTEGMWPGTNPSIAVLPNGGYIVAFNANTGELFTYSTAAGTVNTTEGMKVDTSPSITP